MAQTKKGKSTPSKNKSKNVKSTAAKGRKAQQQTNPEISGEVMLILFFVVCVILFLSCFGLCGVVGEAVRSLLFGLFGYLSYGMPIALFVGVCFYLANKENTVAAIKVAAALVLLFVLEGLLHGLIGNHELETIKEAYLYCAVHHEGAGILGAAIFGMLSGALGVIGAYVLLLALGIAAAVLISEKSFVKGVKKGSKKVYDTAKEENIRRKERAEERREKRLERKASGVSMDVKLAQDAVHKEDMTELTGIKETAREEVFFSSEMAEIPVHQEKPIVRVSTPAVETPFTEREEPADIPVKKTVSKRKAEKPAVVEPAPEDPVILNPENESVGNGKQYQAPPLELLNAPKVSRNAGSTGALRETAAKLQQILKDFGVNVTVTDVSCGPTVTRYELQPDHGVKVSKILSLADDIKLNLAVADIRIEAPIPGKAAVGIEVPNKENSTVTLRELLESDDFKTHKSNLAFAVGKDIGGKTVITDIAKMPHLLIAGATGSGKSVCINTLIMSLLYKASPEDVKLIMVDPKVVELSTYNGIPHLLIPVVTDPKKAAGALNWAVAEMTRRYQLFADYQVRNLQGYNDKVKSIEMLEDEEKPQKLPQIVIIVDELADLMMVAPGDVEDAICRLAQLARAAGIHLIIATQRPSVNVITGLIKANMPSRLAFAVSSGVDSRTILDMNGAEKLLGKGDMLFYPYGYPKPVRIQGAFVSDDEVNQVVEFLKIHNEAAAVNPEIEEQMKKQQTAGASGTKAGAEDSGNGNDPLFVEAGKFIIEKDKASIGMLQRWFKIGFNRAARIMDQLAEAGVVGEEQGTKPREILMSPEQFEQYIEEYL